MFVSSAMPELVYHLTYIVQPRYSGALLNGLEFYNKTSLVNLNSSATAACVKDDFRSDLQFQVFVCEAY